MSYPPGPYGPPAVAQPPAPRGGGGRVVRGVIAGLMLFLAAMLTVPAVLAQWGHRTLDDTDAFVAAVSPLSEDPTVRKAIASQVSTAVVDQLQLGDVFSGAVGSLVDTLSLEAMKTQAFATAWDTTNARAQQAFVAALSGNSGDVSVSGNDVVLDVSGIVADVKSGLVKQGIGIASAIQVPQGALQIRLMDAATLASLQDFYQVANPVAGWLPLLVLVLYVAAVLVAPARGLVLALSGLSLLGSALAVGGLVALGSAAFTRELSGQPFAPAASAYYEALTHSLATTWPVLAGVGAVLVVVGSVWAFLRRGSRRTA